MINNSAFTKSEEYLQRLANRTFLSLWSYPNVFRKKSKELCDLLVIVGNDIIIFSDKDCVYSATGDGQLDWSRWFRHAVADSARQLWGAEKWIKKYPFQIYLDKHCEDPLPFPIEITSRTKFHLVLVAHGASLKVDSIFGDGGSLMFCNEIKGLSMHTKPFTIGDLDVTKTFIHVLDDNTLNILLENRDTISDFTEYLNKREDFLRSDKLIFSPGEEELLSFYLLSIEENGEHDFILPEEHQKSPRIALESGGWNTFQTHPQRIAQLKIDKASYMWDGLIEHFSAHAVNGTQHRISSGGFSDIERALRMLALETRFTRRVLAISLKEIIHKTPRDLRAIRVVPIKHDNTYFVFVLLPYTECVSYERYREIREQFLEKVCMIVKLDWPDAQHVIGLAMESGVPPSNFSEDLIYFDCDCWDKEMENQAKHDKEQLGVFSSPTFIENIYHEFPME